MNKHTPGPWLWERRKHPKGGWRLYHPGHGHLYVMDFGRLGMQGGQPRFSDRVNADETEGGCMVDADELDLTQHPDARLIAAAPELLKICREVLASWFTGRDEFADIEPEIIRDLRAAIIKAEATHD